MSFPTSLGKPNPFFTTTAINAPEADLNQEDKKFVSEYLERRFLTLPSATKEAVDHIVEIFNRYDVTVDNDAIFAGNEKYEFPGICRVIKRNYSHNFCVKIYFTNIDIVEKQIRNNLESIGEPLPDPLCQNLDSVITVDITTPAAATSDDRYDFFDLPEVKKLPDELQEPCWSNFITILKKHQVTIESYEESSLTLRKIFDDGKDPSFSFEADFTDPLAVELKLRWALRKISALVPEPLYPNILTSNFFALPELAKVSDALKEECCLVFIAILKKYQVTIETFQPALVLSKIFEGKKHPFFFEANFTDPMDVELELRRDLSNIVRSLPAPINPNVLVQEQLELDAADPIDDSAVQQQLAQSQGTMEEHLKKAHEELLSNERHNVRDDILNLLKLKPNCEYQKFHDLLLEKLFDEEGHDSLLECLTDPISVTQLKTPWILTDTGHSVDRSTVDGLIEAKDKWGWRLVAKNPFSRGLLCDHNLNLLAKCDLDDIKRALSREHSFSICKKDLFTEALLDAINCWELKTYGGISAEARKSVQRLKSEEYFISGNIDWMHLLTALMPAEDSYFVRSKGPNHFVLVIRPDLTKIYTNPLNPTEPNPNVDKDLAKLLQDNNVIQISFSYDDRGRMRFIRDAGEGSCPDIETLLKSLGCNGFKPFTRGEAEAMRRSMGITKFLQEMYWRGSAEGLQNRNLLKQLELRLTRAQISDIFAKTIQPNANKATADKLHCKFLFRPSVSSIAGISFTGTTGTPAVIEDTIERLAALKFTISRGKLSSIGYEKVQLSNGELISLEKKTPVREEKDRPSIGELFSKGVFKGKHYGDPVIDPARIQNLLPSRKRYAYTAQTNSNDNNPAGGYLISLAPSRRESEMGRLMNKLYQKVLKDLCNKWMTSKPTTDSETIAATFDGWSDQERQAYFYKQFETMYQYMLSDAVNSKVCLSVRGLLALPAIYTIDDFRTALLQVFNNEGKLDELLECLTDPISAERLTNPMLLADTKSVNKSTADQLKAMGVITGKSFNAKVDLFTQALLKAKTYWELEMSGKGNLSAIKELESKEFCLSGNIYGIYLLKTFMPTTKYFVHCKGFNHFVLVIRPDLAKIYPNPEKPTEPDPAMDKDLVKLVEENSVIQISFCYDEQGHIRFFGDKSGDSCPDIETLLKSLGCDDFQPLAGNDVKALEDSIGITDFLYEMYANSPEGKQNRNLTRQLGLSLTHQQIRTLFKENRIDFPVPFLFRPGGVLSQGKTDCSYFTGAFTAKNRGINRNHTDYVNDRIEVGNEIFTIHKGEILYYEKGRMIPSRNGQEATARLFKGTMANGRRCGDPVIDPKDITSWLLKNRYAYSVNPNLGIMTSQQSLATESEMRRLMNKVK
jgi:hypothetical protein